MKRKEGNQSKEKKETSKTDALGGWSPGNNVCLISLRLTCIKWGPANI